MGSAAPIGAALLGPIVLDYALDVDMPMPEPQPTSAPPADDEGSCVGAGLHGFATLSFTLVALMLWWRSLSLPVLPEAQTSLSMLLHMGSMMTAWLASRHSLECLESRAEPPSMARAIVPGMMALASVHVALVAGAMIH